MKKLIVSPLAEMDLKEAYQWYELNKVGLGNLFLKAVKDKLQRITLNPHQYPKRYKNTRVAMVVNFPFIIHFLEQEDTLVVFSVYHSKRNPKHVFKRLGK